MAASVTCDECGKVAPMAGLAGWHRVTRLGLDVSVLGERPSEGDFCSTECLTAFYKKPAGQKTQKLSMRALF